MKNSSLLTYRGLSLSFCHLFGPVLLFSCPRISKIFCSFAHSHQKRKTYFPACCKTWTGFICKTWTGLEICKTWTYTNL